MTLMRDQRIVAAELTRSNDGRRRRDFTSCAGENPSAAARYVREMAWRRGGANGVAASRAVIIAQYRSIGEIV